MKPKKMNAAPERTNRKKAKAEDGIPLVVVYWALGLGFMSYLVSRFVLEQHPLHWASAVGGVLLGMLIGYIWFFIRGDVGLI